MSKQFIGSTGLSIVLNHLKDLLAKKVDVVEGKGLSTVDFTDTAYVHTDNNYDASAVAEVAKISGKVDKVEGKTLTTNDLTDELKAQYDAAEANVLTSVKVNGTALTITDKAVDITMPTVDTAMSDSSTNAVQNKVVKDYIDEAIGGITGITYDTSATKVADLPATGEKGVIYLIPNSGSNGNIYDEYIWAKTGTSGEGDTAVATYGYEKIGTTETDLSDYIKADDITEIATKDINAAFNSTFGTTYSVE